MILLTSNSQTIEVLLGGAVTTNELQWSSSFITRKTKCNCSSGSECSTDNSLDGVTTGATAVTIVSAPTLNNNTDAFSNQVEYISVYNSDTVTQVVTIRLKDGANTRTLIKVSLPSGSHVVYNEDSGWDVLDSNGAIITSAGVSSVSGTANRITVSPTTGNVVVDIASTYVGQTSITTVGTITTGTWNGGVVSGQFGGTGVNNSGKTITLSGNIITTGAFNTTFAQQASVTITLPPVATTLPGKTGTMVAGYISYWNDANQITGDTNLQWVSANQFLQIKDHVNGDANISIRAPGLTTNSFSFASAGNFTDSIMQGYISNTADGGYEQWGITASTTNTVAHSFVGLFNNTGTINNYPAIQLRGGKRSGTSLANLTSSDRFICFTNDPTGNDAITGGNVACMMGDGSFKIGDGVSPTRKLEILDASNPQLRLTQANASVFADVQVTSTGHLDLLVTNNGLTRIGTSTYGGLFVNPSVNTRDGGWNLGIELQANATNAFPAIILSNQTGATRFGGIISTRSSTGDVSTSQQAQFKMYESGNIGVVDIAINGNIGTTGPTNMLRLRGDYDVYFGTTTGDVWSLGAGNTFFNVATGITNNAERLQIIANGTGTAGFQMGNTTIRRCGISGVDGSDMAFFTNTTNSGTTLTQAFRLLSAGNAIIGTATAAASWLAIRAGTASISSINLASGTLKTTAAAGDIEYNGTDLFFTKTGTTRGTVYVETPRNHSAVTLAINTARTPNATHDVMVVITFNLATGSGQTATGIVQVDNSGGGTFTTIATTSSAGAVLLGLNLTQQQVVTFICPMTSQYKWNNTGTAGGGATTVTSIYELIL